VTFQEYDNYVRATGASRPSDQTRGRGSNPVINVSWEDAVAYTRWLSKETGKTYRLPTEAEWEYAARGGREVGIWWDLYDDEVHARCANCDFRNPNPDRPVSVERFPGHPYRLHNTSGNVKEWVQDCYVRGYSGAPADGRARGGSCSERVVRGGSYLSQMQELRASARSRLNGSVTSFEIGFRVVREN
jgi:formylglycine-generating enzyme required for sulfatase activity